jgi:hypothetical protein
MNRRLKLFLLLGIAMVLVLSLALAAPAFAAKGGTPFITTQTVPISFTFEAGHDYTPTWWTEGGKVIHGGTGWVTPLGRAQYVAVAGWPGAAVWQPKFMTYPSFTKLFPGMGLFCDYRLPDGDIYAFDGIMGGIEPVTNDDGKIDYLVNIIVGGTGRYENASGILIGRTPGRGSNDGTSSPRSLIKIMQGYINLKVKHTLSLGAPFVPISNMELNPDAWTILGNGSSFGSTYNLVPMNMEMEAGFQFYQPSPDFGGLTIHSGIGWLEPFGRAQYWAGMYPAAVSTLRPDFMNDASWKSMFGGTDLFCVYRFNANDAFYAWDGIMGNIQPVWNDDGKIDCLINVVCGGTGAFKNASGLFIGYTPGRGRTQVTSTQIGLPLSILKLMEGYIRLRP